MASIKELMEQQTSNELAKKRLKFILDELAKKQRELSVLESKMYTEHEDVEALEKMSVKSVFRKILGDKEAQLEKERQEYLHAFMKYEEFKKTLDILEYEKGVLQEKVANAVNVSKQIKKQLAIRKKEVMLNGSALGKKITALESEINRFYYIRKECLEAVEVGKSAIAIMYEMIRTLNTARGWGSYRRGSRGGMSKIIRMSSVDKAKKLSHQAQQLLRVFSKELADINGQQNFNFRFDFGGFDSFLNIFFDNLISDWVVNQKIVTAQNSVVSTQTKVKRIVSSLEVDIKNAEAEVVYREEKVKQLIRDSV